MSWRLRHLPGLIASQVRASRSTDSSERRRRRHELPVVRGQCRPGFLSELDGALVKRRRGSRRLALHRTIGGWFGSHPRQWIPACKTRPGRADRSWRASLRRCGPRRRILETLKAIADGGTEGNAVYMSPSKFQPVAADDVAATLVEIATAQPKNGVVELAGPEASSMAEFIQSFLSSIGDERKVIPDPDAK